jgi:tetratricopeptide (TPR) repeat protein
MSMNLTKESIQEQQEQLQIKVQQSRTIAIANLEASLQKATESASVQSSIEQFVEYINLNLSLALELTATRQPPSLKRAKELTQTVAIALQANSENAGMSAFGQLAAHWQYVEAVLALESGNNQGVLSHLESACQGYLDCGLDIASVHDLFGHYYLRTNDFGEALLNFERSLKVRMETHQGAGIGKSYANLGEWYLTVAEIGQAEQLFQNALDLALTVGDHNLRLQALSGLAKVAIAESRYADAIAMIEDAIPQLQEPAYAVDLGYWYCDLTKALLGIGKVEESLICMRINVLPCFREFNNQRGMAIARQLRGRIYTRRMLEGLDVLDEEAIETAEDSLLDASFSFEQMGMMLDYAKALYDLACLYQLSSGSHFYYQYQGKSLRSLELVVSILEKINLGEHPLAQKADQMLMQVLQSKF